MKKHPETAPVIENRSRNDRNCSSESFFTSTFRDDGSSEEEIAPQQQVECSHDVEYSIEVSAHFYLSQSCIMTYKE